MHQYCIYVDFHVLLNFIVGFVKCLLMIFFRLQSISILWELCFYAWQNLDVIIT